MSVRSSAAPLAPRFRVPSIVPLALLPGLVLAGCAGTVAQRLEDGEVSVALGERGRAPSFELDPRVIAGLEALALPRPTSEECRNPREAGFWRAAALAWNPEVRATRFELEGALASAGAAGRPGPIGAMGEVMELSDPEAETKVALTFDLLGILGLGPTAAAREEARAEARRAKGRFEAAVWKAVHEADRARMRLAASRDRIERLTHFLGEIQAEAPRFEVLERRGRLSEAEAAMIDAAPHEIEHALSEERGREAELTAALAATCGLATGNAAFAAIDGTQLHAELAEPPLAPATIELLRVDPALRELTFEFAVAEAAVRSAAAQAWPRLGLGPQFLFQPSDVLVGGLLEVELPWPGTVEREVRAKAAARDAARARVEDGLLAAEARVASLATIARETRLRAEEHAPAIDEAAAANWHAVEARLSRNASSVSEWLIATRGRLDALLALVDQREAARIALIDLAEACGIRASAETTGEVRP